MTSQNNTITANGNTTTLSWLGGTGTFTTSGTFDSATVKLQQSPDGTNFVDVGLDTTHTADGVANFVLPPCDVRVNTASGGGSLSVTAWVRQ